VEVGRHAFACVFACVFAGSGRFAGASAPFGVLLEREIAGEEVHIRGTAGDRTPVAFDRRDGVEMTSGDHGMRFLLVSGKPIKEPVAWHGPIVMNAREELVQAVRELNGGTFIR
jgi:hypothetical protein